MSITTDLEHIVLAYDRKQETKKHYNIYALGIYLKRVDEVVAEIENGKSIGDAITSGFNDRLRDFILKSLEKRGYSLDISEDVEQYQYTDFDRQGRVKTSKVPGRYADNALALDEEDETSMMKVLCIRDIEYKGKTIFSVGNIYNVLDKNPKIGMYIMNGYPRVMFGKNHFKPVIDEDNIGEDVQQYQYTVFDRQGRVKTTNVPGRYADNALALDEEFDISALDRLQSIFNNADIDDASISRGIELSRAGYQKVASMMKVSVNQVRMMINSLITKIRKEKESDTTLGEGYETLLDDQEQYSYEPDALGSVTIRNINSGEDTFIHGTEASSFLNAIESGMVDPQHLMASYMSEHELDEEFDGLEEDSYDSEIASDFGTYNFPWKLSGFNGTGTAEYSNSGVRLVSVRDIDGDEMEMDDQERSLITKQAVEFIRHV